jgi:tetratricopeptide (TPR) repeat protein
LTTGTRTATPRLPSGPVKEAIMPSDLYGPCPCGSGKKFKWCCYPIHVQIGKAFEQEEAGQHEAAVRTMDEVIARNRDNPEAHGRKAQLLFQMDRTEEAEAVLQTALELNPNYAFGHYLRGQARAGEGEIAGALLLFRKAADLYDQEAHDILAGLYGSIFECELRLNRPVAARAALQIALRHDPAVETYRQALENLFGDKSHFALSARREYRFLGAASAGQSAAWRSALQTAATGKLRDALHAFEKLTEAEPGEAAWYNLGLSRAWLGDNAGAVDALERYVGLEADEGRAAAAWALAEVLRCGAGMEDQADYVEHSALFQVRDPQRLVTLLHQLIDERRFIPTETRQEEGFLLGMLLEPVQALTPELAAKKSPRLAGFVLIVGGLVHLRSLNQERLLKGVAELRQRGAGVLSEPEMGRGPAPFQDILSEAAVLPLGAADKEEAQRRVDEGIADYLENTWIHKPLRALSGVPPVDAAGHGNLRTKLRGVLQFLQECAEATAQPYDFDRLRRKLGLVQAPAAAGPGQAAPDPGSMSAAELSALAPESLADEPLEQAYQAALRLDAREVAGRFARALISRPPRAGHADRYPIYGQLTQQALAAGDADAALKYVTEGEDADRAHNEGKRGNDFALRRGQILARRGDVDAAQDVFNRLVEGAPAELRFAAAAAEALLSAHQGPRALAFAEAGLARARQMNNRDSEQHFLELVDAARRQGG